MSHLFLERCDLDHHAETCSIMDETCSIMDASHDLILRADISASGHQGIGGFRPVNILERNAARIVGG
jgi:hypothetical protein